jgi:hypothetical protein
LRLYSVDDKMINEYGAIGGMRIDKGDWNMCSKPAPLPRCPPHIPHDLAYNLIWAAAVRGLSSVTAQKSSNMQPERQELLKPWLWIPY